MPRMDAALYQEPQLEVLIEQEELHCRATGVFGVPAPLRGLVKAIPRYPRLTSNQTHEASFVDVREGLETFQIEERMMRQVSFTPGT